MLPYVFLSRCRCLHIDIPGLVAKEKRRYYTLDPVPDNMVDAPSETSITPTVSPHSPRPSTIPVPRSPSTIGPDRANRVSKQARLNAGPLAPRHKERVLADKANAEILASPVNVPTIQVPPVTTSQMNMLQTQADASATDGSRSGSTEPNIIATTDSSLAMTPVIDDNASDGGSYTSTLPDVFDVGMDDSAPLATGPWVIMDHLTGEVIVDDDEPIATIPTVPPQCEIEIGVLPRLGTHILIETGQPTLLYEDEEVRPRWLILAVKDFLKYTPYYGRLSKVVDLFLGQEARLGYPELVMYLLFTLLHFPADNPKSVRLALPSRNRPTEVGQFQKWARNYSRGDNVDPNTFGASVLNWWRTIQPTTRKQWPPTYDPLPDDFSFDYFNRGGPNGVFLMVLCLGWWAGALTADTDMTDYTSVVNDVCWVLEQIASRA